MQKAIVLLVLFSFIIKLITLIWCNFGYRCTLWPLLMIIYIYIYDVYCFYSRAVGAIAQALLVMFYAVQKTAVAKAYMCLTGQNTK